MDFESEETLFSPNIQPLEWSTENEFGRFKPQDFIFSQIDTESELEAEALLDEIFSQTVNSDISFKDQKYVPSDAEIAKSEIEAVDSIIGADNTTGQDVIGVDHSLFTDSNDLLQLDISFDSINNESVNQQPEMPMVPVNISPKNAQHFDSQNPSRHFGRAFKPRPKGSKRFVSEKRVFDYSGIVVPTTFEKSDSLRNVAKNTCPDWFLETYKQKLIRPLTKQQEEMCSIKRGRYIRENIEEILGCLSKDVVYEKNFNFEIARPYEPQYIRYIVDLDSPNMLPFNNTRCGLCAYCPEIHFFDIKTSAYAQHLALQHGIYTDNFLTPNPLLFGHYKIKKPENPNRKEKRKTQAHELERDGVVCPCCYEIIGVNCSKKTANFKPLTNYMRHFRDKHIYCKNKHDPYMYFNKFEI